MRCMYVCMYLFRGREKVIHLGQTIVQKTADTYIQPLYLSSLEEGTENGGRPKQKGGEPLGTQTSFFHSAGNLNLPTSPYCRIVHAKLKKKLSVLGRHTCHDRAAKWQPLPPPPPPRHPVQVFHAFGFLGARNILASPVIPVSATQLQAGAPLPEMALITCAHDIFARYVDIIFRGQHCLQRWMETPPQNRVVKYSYTHEKKLIIPRLDVYR